ncbi:MAG: hypothetical protein EOO04_31820, partial [Chitinophagaceae bacterium]
MLKKIIFTITLFTCVCVLPSYTNTCARPDADFMKTKMLKPGDPEKTERSARKAGHGLEVFPLEFI